MNILLTTEKTPLPSGIISMEQASWVTSLLSVGAIFSNIVFGFLANHFGRKILLFLIGLPMIVRYILGWTMSENKLIKTIDETEIVYIFVLVHSYPDQLGIDLVCSGNVLPLHISVHWWIFWCRRLYDHSDVSHRSHGR